VNDNANTVTTTQEVATPKKRGRKPNPDKRKLYFDAREEEAFRQYLTATDKTEKDEIFHKILYPALSKMVECIIRRYNLSTPKEDYENTFNDTLSFLMTKTSTFNPAKNKKAYSYCGTICKNYLIFKMTSYSKKESKNSSYETVYNEHNPDVRSNEERENETVEFNQELLELIRKRLIQYLEKKPNMNENERKVGYALCELLEHWDEIFNNFDGDETKKYNKTNVLYYIKENTLLTTTEVRNAMKMYKKLYRNTKKRFLESQI